MQQYKSGEHRHSGDEYRTHEDRWKRDIILRSSSYLWGNIRMRKDPEEVVEIVVESQFQDCEQDEQLQ